MELMQASPIEKRFDDLDRKVDRGFERVDHRFERVDDQFKLIDERFERVDERFKRVDERFVQVEQRLDRIELELRAHGNEFIALRKELKAGFERMEERFDERSDATHRLLVQVSASLLGTVILASAGLIATQL
jgi:hypothetical protein